MRSKVIIFLVTFFLFLQPMAQTEAAISAYEPDIPLGNWKSPPASQLFKIDGSSENNFIHTEDWYVEVDGQRVGQMMLMRPKTDGSKGLTFAHKSTLKQWGQVLNGNPAYVESATMPRDIKNVTYGKVYQRYYSRDIARNSGAHEPTIQGSGEYSKWGHRIGVLKIKTTPFPKPNIAGPATVKKGETVTYTISGEEFSPYEDWIKWKFNEGGTLLDDGQVYNNTFSKSVKVKFDNCGTKTLKLYVTDEVQREKSTTKTIKVEGCESNGGSTPVDPNPDPDEPEGVPKPPDSGEQGGAGSARGKAFWELRRADVDQESKVYVKSGFRINGSHYATRNPSHSIQFGGRTVVQPGEIESMASGRSVKGSSLNYTFQYEYTNYPIGWQCSQSGTDKDGNSICLNWTFNSNPDWSKGQTFRLSGSIPINHKQGDTIKNSSLDNILGQKFLVGREDTWNPGKSTKDYFEQWEKTADAPKSSYTLKTQSTLPITPGTLKYQVELPSGEHAKSGFQTLKKEKSHGFFFPADVDDSLKKEYKNRSSYSSYQYAFPLQQRVMKDKGMSGSKRSFEYEYVTDLFFTSKYTGYMVGTPYTQKVKQHFVKGTSIPSHSSLMKEGEQKIKSSFKEDTGETFGDEVLYTKSESEMQRLQRYAIPVSPTSPLKPKETYKNHIVLENMGLSDLVFEYDQSFKFNHYLFGSGADDAWIIEQADDRQSISKSDAAHIHKIKISNDQVREIAVKENGRTIERMHKFRLIDRDFIKEVKSLVDLGL
ncbi:hypothetical protein [Pseudobacillus badius]|uniref:hypothetical protein n=1 Tax=Bacillus badius TaxID=1455 RepID=UPI001CBB9A89|nr:hypothetical protein [Bacillus badius]UAT32438.1 hypothetical protein K7T73_09615 [Bacillus badius]GLY12725.1 hypothetical protein Bbad01_39410 [Bacillus badius]